MDLQPTVSQKITQAVRTLAPPLSSELLCTLCNGIDSIETHLVMQGHCAGLVWTKPFAGLLQNSCPVYLIAELFS